MTGPRAGVSRFTRHLANPFLRNVATLSGGTLISRIIAIVSLPVLTRLFTPDHYGVLSVFIAVATTTLAVGTLTYDWAIPLPSEDEQGVNLLGVSLIAAFASSLLVLLGLIIFGDSLVEWTSTPGLDSLLLWAPLLAFFTAAQRAFHFWNVRRKAFARTVVARVGRTVGTVVIQIGAGIAGLGSAGLVLGDGIGRGLGAVLMVVQIRRNDGRLLRGISWSKMKGVAREYSRFPKYTSWGSVVTALAQQLPLVVIAATFGAGAAGFMAAAQRLVSLPAVLLGRSVADVFLGEAAELIESDPRRLQRLFWAISRRAALAIVPFGLVAAASPFVFGWIFGSEWAPAGVLVAALAGPYFAEFVVWSTSNLPAYGRNAWQLVWEVVRLVASVGAIYLGAILGLGSTATIALLGATWMMLSAVLWLLNIITIRRLVAQADGQEGS